MVGAREGSGYLIAFLGDGGDYAGMFALAFVVTALGFAADRGYLRSIVICCATGRPDMVGAIQGDECPDRCILPLALIGLWEFATRERRCRPFLLTALLAGGDPAVAGLRIRRAARR